MSGGVGRVGRRACRDLLGYIGEFTDPVRLLCCGSRHGLRDTDGWSTVQKAVDNHEVVIFKLQGCGYCERAQELLGNAGITAFSMLGTEPEIKSVLQDELRQPLITFPVILVRGVYLGGFDQLQDAMESGRFDELRSGPQRHFPEGVGMIEDPMNLLVGPRGQEWYCFQLHVYANYVRMVSLFHIAFFVGAIGLSYLSPVASVLLLWIFAIDMAIFTITGPTPVALISTLATLVVWRFRGPAVTSIPYKIVMGLIYIAVLLPTLLCGIRDWHDCNMKGARLTLVGLILNSSLLAILRF